MTRSFVPPAEGGSYVFDPATGALDLVERGGTGVPEPTQSVAAEAPIAEPAPPVTPIVPEGGDPAAETPSKKSRKD